MARKRTRANKPTAAAVPVEATNLTAAERRLLPDPDWVTEDDADAIIAHRRRNEPSIPFDKYLRKHGYELDD